MYLYEWMVISMDSRSTTCDCMQTPGPRNKCGLVSGFHHCAPSLPVGSGHARLMLWVSKPVIMQGWNQVEQALYIEVPGTSFCNWRSSLTHCQHLVLADLKTADCRGTVVTHSDASSSKVGRSKQKKSSLIPTWDLCQCFNWMLQSSSG